VRSRKFEHMLRGLERKRGIRDASPRFFICCEDGKSAPQYFEVLRKYHKYSPQSFVVDKISYGTDPCSVVDRAVDFKKELEKNEDLCEEDGDRVWVVIDVDQHQGMNDACQRAQSSDIEILISNPCFEYWILLHFEDTAPGVHDCNELIKKHLKRHLKDYDKGKTDYRDFIDRADEAAIRAERQFKAKAESDPIKCCPCTMIYKLIQALPKS